MRRILIASNLLLFLSSVCFSQTAEKEKELSNIERFSAKSGRIVEKEFISLKSVKSADISVLTIKDLMTNEKISGLKVSKTIARTYGSIEKSAFLDTDELDALIASIKLIQTNVFNTQPVNYTEVIFTSRGDFRVGCYYAENKWSAFIKVDIYDNDTNIWLTTDQLNQFLLIVEEAKLKINGQN